MATEDARKLFVAGLPDSMSEDVLRQLFEATGGKVVDVSLPRDRATGRVRGFGFVTFSTADEANRGREQLDGSLQAGRSISVRPFSSEPPRRGDRPEPRGGGAESYAPGPPAAGGGGEDRTLYVGNLPYDTTVPELTQVFTDLGVGPVARIHLPSGPDGRLRGFGFVTLGTAEAANSAIVALRDADVRGRRLMVNIAHPRGERPAGGGFSERPSYGPRSMEPRFPTEPPMAFEGARPNVHQRPARVAGGETDWAEEAKKKKKRGKGGGAGGSSSSRSDEDRRRGGGSSWQAWDKDDDD